MTKEMFEEITAWQKQVFTKATALSAANHLHEEVKELITELSPDGDMRKIEAEYADCFLLLFGSASLLGLSYKNICQAINAKMEINKQRKWGEVNKDGYVKHID
jgi:NTP pyrophosphatase (non-canonical NTP hydrolase)